MGLPEGMMTWKTSRRSTVLLSVKLVYYQLIVPRFGSQKYLSFVKSNNNNLFVFEHRSSVTVATGCSQNM